MSDTLPEPVAPLPSPTPPPRGATWTLRDMLWAALAAVGLVLVGAVGLAVLIALTSLRRAGATPQALSGPIAFGVLALEAVLLIPAWLWGPGKHGGGWARLGLRRTSLLLGLFLAIAGLVLIVAINAVWDVARQALGWPGQPDSLNLFGPGLQGLLLALLAGAIVAPLAEEVFFRGFLYAGLRSRLGLAWGLILSGAIFAVVHVIPGVIPPIFFMGVLFALLYEVTGSIWPCIALHSAVNALAFIGAYVLARYPGLGK
jgi:uncharacterized protein